MLIDIDRQNLQKLISEYNYEFQYLKAESKVFTVKQSESDLHYWKDNQMKVKGRRRIYYRVDYDQKQNMAIDQLMQEMPKNGVFIKLSRQLILKHLHVQNFNIPSTIQRLKDLQTFYYSSITQLKPDTIQNLNKGFIYTYGYSKNYRPILIIRVDKISPTMEVQEIFNTLYYLMVVLCQYKMQPYHSEKYIIIIDLNHMNIGQIPYSRIFNCLTKLSLYSCGFTDQNFVVNASGIWAVWTFIKTFLPQYAIKKVIFLDDMKPLLDVIDPEELQERYGGTRKNIQEGQFWPPLQSKKCGYNPSKSLEEYEDTDYHSVANNQAMFSQGYVDLTSEAVNSGSGCCGQTDCKIY